MRVIALLVTVTLITACSPKLLKVLPDDKYLLDLEEGVMCRSTDCFDLSLIVPSFNHRQVEKAYQIDQSEFKWDEASLINLMLNPTSGEYKVTKLAANEYQLPSTPQTNAVYAVLKEEHLIMYGGMGGAIFDFGQHLGDGVKLNDPNFQHTTY